MKLKPDVRMDKEQFLIEHNKLSPINLRATFDLLTRFQQEKKPLLKDTDWSSKLRIPFISWLNAMPVALFKKEKPIEEEPEKQEYKNYPETKF